MGHRRTVPKPYCRVKESTEKYKSLSGTGGLMERSKQRGKHKQKQGREHTFGKYNLLEMTRVQEEKWGRTLD